MNHPDPLNNAVTAAAAPRWSIISCSRPRPCAESRMSSAEEMTRTLLESDHAWPSGVRMLVSPGPVMVKHTPGLPVARA